MDKLLIKNTVIFSLLLGLILGLIAVIPKIGLLGLISVSLLAAPLVMVYMIMDGKFELSTPKDSIIVGSIVGFSANITFSAAYLIITSLIYVIFHYTNNIFLTKMVINAPIWLLFVCITFIGVLIATTNAFTGFLTHYSINFIRDIYEKQNEGK